MTFASMVNDLTNMAEIRARDKGITINVEMDENIPHILVGDEMRLRQCTTNILPMQLSTRKREI